MEIIPRRMRTVLWAALLFPGSFMLLGWMFHSCSEAVGFQSPPPGWEMEPWPEEGPDSCVVWERDGVPVSVSHEDWAHLVPGGSVSADSALGREALKRPCRRMPLFK